jgi:hypothetical protein
VKRRDLRSKLADLRGNRSDFEISTNWPLSLRESTFISLPEYFCAWSLQLTYKKKLKVLRTMERLGTIKTIKLRNFDMDEEVQDGGEIRGSREGQDGGDARGLETVEMLEMLEAIETLERFT